LISHDDLDILRLDADIIDEYLEGHKDPDKTAQKIEINLVARIQEHSNDPKFIKLGERLEELREKHEQGFDKGKAALTELFDSVKNKNTPIIVERIVKDIDDIVKIVRFDGWQNTTTGKQEVKKALNSVVWVKYKIKDKDLLNKAYGYVEMYY